MLATHPSDTSPSAYAQDKIKSVKNKEGNRTHQLIWSTQGHQVTVEITSGQTYRGRLIEGTFCTFKRSIGTDLTRRNSRRQHERATREHQRDAARRTGHTSRSRLHPWIARAVIHCARHAEVGWSKRWRLLPRRVWGSAFADWLML